MKNQIAVSTWSLHHHLGFSFANGPADAPPFVKHPTWGAGQFDVLQLPFELASYGYTRCELCHFHVGSLDPMALSEIAGAFASAGVVLQTLLIDDGDVTNAATRQRDIAWMNQWIEAAAGLKAEHVRVIAGKALPTAETLALSVSALRPMVALGAGLGVKVVTENWYDLLSNPAAVHHVLDQVPGLGFMADTGNWSGATKYADLASIFARADLCHAKAEFADGLQLNAPDFAACLKAAQQAGYAGPMTLIFADAGNEWDGLAVERRFIQNA
jgi:sugar phosphate isomerase/epimerase